jgi:hypothetical protein
VQIIERLHQVLRASPPARQLGDQDGVDLACLGELHHLLALGAVVLGPRSRFLEHGDNLVLAAPGEGAKVSFLALARLILRADPAVDRDLSQLNPLGNWTAKVPHIHVFRSESWCIKYSFTTPHNH